MTTSSSDLPTYFAQPADPVHDFPGDGFFEGFESNPPFAAEMEPPALPWDSDAIHHDPLEESRLATDAPERTEVSRPPVCYFLYFSFPVLIIFRSISILPVSHAYPQFVCGTDDPSLTEETGRLIFGEIDLENNTIRMDPAQNKLRMELHKMVQPVRAIEWPLEGHVLVAMGNYITRWSIDSNFCQRDPIAWFPQCHTQPIRELASHPTEKNIFLSCACDGSVCQLDMERDPSPVYLPQWSGPHYLAQDESVGSVRWCTGTALGDSFSLTTDEGFFRLVDRRTWRDSLIFDCGAEVFTHLQLTDHEFLLGLSSGVFHHLDTRAMRRDLSSPSMSPASSPAAAPPGPPQPPSPLSIPAMATAAAVPPPALLRPSPIGLGMMAAPPQAPSPFLGPNMSHSQPGSPMTVVVTTPVVTGTSPAPIPGSPLPPLSVSSIAGALPQPVPLLNPGMIGPACTTQQPAVVARALSDGVGVATAAPAPATATPVPAPAERLPLGIVQRYLNPTGVVGDLRQRGNLITCTGKGLSFWSLAGPSAASANSRLSPVVNYFCDATTSKTEGDFLDDHHFAMTDGTGKLWIVQC
ncbi:hypothetical protein PAPYR_1689 [Paratrimastix pyriformis]|uniref:Uncharacterized protein n=1 Tax=Paratrimastix pyriformis TaxID=342808 RepID=A0ABQ8US82_9EUKA|nr:hypothetical protein PAPYR_1689 [Paratrimastix pyriformis]